MSQTDARKSPLIHELFDQFVRHLAHQFLLLSFYYLICFKRNDISRWYLVPSQKMWWDNRPLLYLNYFTSLGRKMRKSCLSRNFPPRFLTGIVIQNLERRGTWRVLGNWRMTSDNVSPMFFSGENYTKSTTPAESLFVFAHFRIVISIIGCSCSLTDKHDICPNDWLPPINIDYSFCVSPFWSVPFVLQESIPRAFYLYLNV